MSVENWEFEGRLGKSHWPSDVSLSGAGADAMWLVNGTAYPLYIHVF